MVSIRKEHVDTTQKLDLCLHSYFAISAPISRRVAAWGRWDMVTCDMDQAEAKKNGMSKPGLTSRPRSLYRYLPFLKLP